MFAIDPRSIAPAGAGWRAAWGASLLLVLRLNQDDCRVVGEDARQRRHVADGPGGDRVEARRQPISERDKPQLAEVEEPGVYAGVRVPRRIGSHSLGEFP